MAVEGTSQQDEAGWLFDLTDPLVTQLQIDYRFSMLLAGGALVVIEGPFDLSNRAGMLRVSPEPWERPAEIVPALSLFNQRVTECRAATSGELLLRFANGAELRVPVRQQYESWQIVLSTGEQWIGLPAGGGVTHFPAA